MNRIALIAIIILSLLTVALVVWQTREVLQTLAITLVLVAGLNPLVLKAMQRGLSRGRAVTLVFLTSILILVVWLVIFAIRGYAEVTVLLEHLPTWYEATLVALRSGNEYAQRVSRLLPDSSDLMARLVDLPFGDWGKVVLQPLGQLIQVSTLGVLIATLTYFWLLDQPRIERLGFSLLPLDLRQSMRTLWDQLFNEVGHYTRTIAIIVMGTALGLLAVYSVFQVPGAALLALWGGVSQVVPLLGLPLALVPGAIVALSQGVETGSLAIIGSLAVLLVVRRILVPLLFPPSAVNPVWVVFMIMALAELGGVLMIVWAPLIAAALQVVLRLAGSGQRPVTTEIPTEETSEFTDEVGELQARLDRIAERLPLDSDTPSPLTDFFNRTRQLLNETKEAVETTPGSS